MRTPDLSTAGRFYLSPEKHEAHGDCDYAGDQHNAGSDLDVTDPSRTDDPATTYNEQDRVSHRVDTGTDRHHDVGMGP